MANERQTLIDRVRTLETINPHFVGTDNRDWTLV